MGAVIYRSTSEILYRMENMLVEGLLLDKEDKWEEVQTNTMPEKIATDMQPFWLQYNDVLADAVGDVWKVVEFEWDRVRLFSRGRFKTETYEELKNWRLL